MSTTVDDVLGKGSITIGEEIPLGKWTYVEIQMDRRSMQIYHQTQKVYGGNLGKGLDEDENNTFIDITVHCRLCQAVTNPDLDHFFTKARIAAPSVGTYYHEGHDHY